MIVTAPEAPVRLLGPSPIYWSCLARRGMLHSECQAVNYVRLSPWSQYAAAGDGIEDVWYVIAGHLNFSDPSGTRSVRAGDLLLIPAGEAVSAHALAGPVELLIMQLLPRELQRRLPSRSPEIGRSSQLRKTSGLQGREPMTRPARDEVEVLSGLARCIPTATNVDHIAYTVPSLEAAVAFFVDVLGARLLYRDGPIAHDQNWMSDQLNVHPRAVASVAMLRLGPVTNLELLEYSSPDQRREMPRNSDYGGHHLAVHVSDINAAIAYLRSQPGVEVLGEPQVIQRGPIAGSRWVYFLTPWGMQLELTSPPDSLPYEATTRHRRFGPCSNWEDEIGVEPDETTPH